MMKVLKFIGLSIAKAYYDQACAHIPLHPDMPKIVVKRQEVRDELEALFK